jgi:hypothetical protein
MNIGKLNLALDDRRANAIKDYLVSQGISGDRIPCWISALPLSGAFSETDP